MVPKNENNSNHYLLITPAKDEESYLPILIKSVRNQILRPNAWIIIDDSSSDKTTEIIKAAEQSNLWIHGIFLESHLDYNIEHHYSNICKTGFDSGIKYMDVNNMRCDFIALSDADMVFPDDYFLKLIEYLEKNPEYGLVSGTLMIRDNTGKTYQENKILPNKEMPLGTGRVWRFSTFIETGGYLNVRAPDTVSYILAILRGWKTSQIPDLICYQTRDTGSKINFWQGYARRGERAYYLNSNILSVFNTVIDYIFISRQIHSIEKSLAFLFGYFSSYAHRDEQIPIEEVRKFMGSYKKTFQNYLQVVKKGKR